MRAFWREDPSEAVRIEREKRKRVTEGYEYGCTVAFGVCVAAILIMWGAMEVAETNAYWAGALATVALAVMGLGFNWLILGRAKRSGNDKAT